MNKDVNSNKMPGLISIENDVMELSDKLMHALEENLFKTIRNIAKDTKNDVAVIHFTLIKSKLEDEICCSLDDATCLMIAKQLNSDAFLKTAIDKVEDATRNLNIGNKIFNCDINYSDGVFNAISTCY